MGIGALVVGIVQAGLDASIEYAKVRSQFGKPIAEFQAVQWMIADMTKDAAAARLLVQDAGRVMALGPARHHGSVNGQVFRG